MFNTVTQNKRTTYNKELVWIFNVLFILNYISIVSSSSQNEPPHITKGVSNSNAHIIQELDTGMDYSDGRIFEILDESVKFSDDNALHEGKDSSEIFLQLDENRDSFARDIGDSEEDTTRSANLGHFDGCSNQGKCYRHGSDFSCCCNPGYTGKQCETKIPNPPDPVPADDTVSKATPLDDITRACHAVDNCSAHYTCGNDGSRRCLPGWDGQDCDQLVPNSEADCTLYDYENDFINSHWNGTFECGNNSLVPYTLIVSRAGTGAGLFGTFTTDQFSVVMAGQYVAFTKFLLLQSDKSEIVSWNNYSGISMNMRLNSDFHLTGSVHFSGDGGAVENCISDLHRTQAYFDGCGFHGDCYRYGRNKNDFKCCCEQGFHGLFCETQTTISPPTATPTCHPVNNCSAHYKCYSDGTKQCLPGWRGDNCNEIIPNSVADCSYYDLVECQEPGLKPNATAKFKMLNGLEHATITCIDEAGQQVKEELDCKNGTWSIYAFPQCLAGYKLITQSPTLYRPTLRAPSKNNTHSLHCPPITSMVNGVVTLTGVVASFTCDGDLNLLGSPSLDCINGTWNDSLPICSNCEPMTTFQNGKVEYISGQTFDTATFTCLEGYDLRGDEVSHCLNGVWSHNAPVCVLSASSCSPLPKIENGLVGVGNISNGSSAVYVCNRGYNIVGVVVRYCINGNWTDEEPYCRITDCGTPDVPDNCDVALLGGTVYRSLAVYSCHLGYYTNDTKSRVCHAQGSWSNAAPTCHIVDCGNLTDPVNGMIEYNVEGINDSRTGYKSEAVYSCNQGFSLMGYTRRICLASGKWSGKPARCVQFEVSVQPCRRHIDSWGTTWDAALPGQTSVKRCQGEYNTGEISRNCSLTGEWELPLYNCVRRGIVNVRQQVEELHNNPNSAGVTHTLDQLANVTTSNDGVGELHAGELESITDSLDTIASISESGLPVTENQSQAYIKTASNMLDQRNAQSWKALSQTGDARGASRVLQSIDRFSGAITRALEQGTKSQISLIQSNIVMQVRKILKDQEAIEFPDSSHSPDWMHGSETGFNLPLQSNTVSSYTGVFYRDLVSIFPNRILTTRNDSNNTQPDSNKTLNSPVLSLQLYPRQHNLTSPLQLTFSHQNPNFRNAVTCSYWNFDSNLWETEGCRIKQSGQDLTVCECNHLTNFAVLMSPWNTESEDSTVIEVISIVGCSVSIVCLLITLSAHMVVWRYVRSDRVVILMNLCMALTASYVIFLAGVNQTQNKDACTAVAALLQYIYLVVFFLMLAEGIEIAVTVLYVFSTKSRIKWILPCAWGIPAIIVGISLGVTKLEGYGTDNFCWLSVSNGLIWAFVGPAVFIILVNVILLTLVLRAMLSSKAVSEKTDKEKIKCSLRCLCVLLPLMGCTWVLGIFYVNERMVWIQYVFAICNSLQGLFIFLFHGFLNKQLRTAIKRRQKKYRDSATTSKELSSNIKTVKREKPLFQANGSGGPYSQPVHLVSYEKRRSVQMRKIEI